MRIDLMSKDREVLGRTQDFEANIHKYRFGPFVYCRLVRPASTQKRHKTLPNAF